MFQKFSFFQWLKNQDNYGQPVSLTYRQGKSFPTSCGGVLTLVHMLLAIAYLVLAVRDLQTPSWTVSAWLTTGVLKTGLTPVYSPDNRLVPSIIMLTSNTTELPKDDLTSYYTIYFSMNNWRNETTYINSVLCNSEKAYEWLQAERDQYCPDYEEWKDARLQNSVRDEYIHLNSWLAPCEDVQDLVNSTNCSSATEARSLQSYLSAKALTYTLLPSGDLADGSSFDVSYADHPVIIGNTIATYPQLQVSIAPVDVQFSTNWFWASIRTFSETFFTVYEQQISYFGSDNIEDSSEKKNLLNVQYHLSTSKSNETWVKADLMSYISSFAGIMSFLIFFFSFVVAPIINFSTDLEMIQQLYTVVEKHKTTRNDRWFSAQKSQSDQMAENDEEDEEFEMRVPFYYPVSNRIGDWFKTQIFCCFSCCKCCQVSTKGSQFRKARDQFYQETDILSIIQNLRSIYFLITGHLKPRHESIQQWFKEYQISNEEESSSDSDEASKDNQSNFSGLFSEVPSAEEIKIQEKIAKAEKLHKNFSRSEYFDFRKWHLEQHQILALTRITNHFKPHTNKLDVLALKRVTGLRVKGLPQEEVDNLTHEFKVMLHNNIHLIRTREKNYKFLQKYDLHEPLNSVIKKVSNLKRDEEKIDQIRDLTQPGLFAPLLAATGFVPGMKGMQLHGHLKTDDFDHLHDEEHQGIN